MKGDANFCTIWVRVSGWTTFTRDLLDTGTLKRYIDELSVTGLTSNPTIFDQAIKKSAFLRSCHPAETEPGKMRRSAVLRSWHWRT